jgi:hypothetical protein
LSVPYTPGACYTPCPYSHPGSVVEVERLGLDGASCLLTDKAQKVDY